MCTQYLLAMGVVTVVGIYATMSNRLFSTDDNEGEEVEVDEKGLTASQFYTYECTMSHTIIMNALTAVDSLRRVD